MKLNAPCSYPSGRKGNSKVTVLLAYSILTTFICLRMFIFYCCHRKWLPTQQLRTTQIYYFADLKVWSSKQSHQPKIKLDVDRLPSGGSRGESFACSFQLMEEFSPFQVENRGPCALANCKLRAILSLQRPLFLGTWPSPSIFKVSMSRSFSHHIILTSISTFHFRFLRLVIKLCLSR